MTRKSGRIVLPVFALLIACGDSTGPHDPCTEDTQFSVDRDDNGLLFSWSGGCGIDGLSVVSGTSTVHWGIRSRSRNRLASPIRYGVVPDNARQTHGLTNSSGLLRVLFSIWIGPVEGERVVVVGPFAAITR